ncbi:hypothetical protein CEXT_316721 [Caerostris extrusa]|uniref:Uncharacterized protein n=1 Tax=Caerostris extrusa TaxID=172846 RepID=A0AAV4SB59_CAEEX|nr:hypothetical protein CEXT_316721 [Caerostris extrusa]
MYPSATVNGCLVSHYLPLFIDDCVEIWLVVIHKPNTDRREYIGQVYRKEPSKKENAILPQVNDALLKKPTSFNPLFVSTETARTESFPSPTCPDKEPGTTTSTLNLLSGIYKKFLQTRKLLGKVFSSQMNLHSL